MKVEVRRTRRCGRRPRVKKLQNVEVEDEIETDDVGLEEELGRRLGCC